MLIRCRDGEVFNHQSPPAHLQSIHLDTTYFLKQYPATNDISRRGEAALIPQLCLPPSQNVQNISDKVEVLKHS